MSQSEPPSGTEAGARDELDQAGQQELIQQIGRTIVQALPPNWQEASVEYRAVGTRRELEAHLIAPNGTRVPIAPPADVAELFNTLRHGMHQQHRGTWISAIYHLTRPASYSVDFNGDHEPEWRDIPPRSEFATELRRYPRASHNIPDWLAERAGARDGGAEVSREMRRAEVFDGTDAQGRPVNDRETLPADEQERVLEYLERAPIVLAARSFDTDRLDPAGSASVPLTFHTDGSWIWPGAVSYYLRAHQVAPQSELLDHIRRSGFRLPYIDEETRELAVSALTAEQQS